VKDTANGLSVHIGGKEFMVACPDGEREQLRRAAAYLDKAMREIQATGKVIGTERAAVMAALNIANELLEMRDRGGLPAETTQRLQQLQLKIDAALNSDRQPRQ
jgi:cell division protein ZapA